MCCDQNIHDKVFRFAAQTLCLVALLFLTFPAHAQEVEEPKLPEDDQCIICHLDLEEIPEDFSKHDVHLKEGLSCAGCHGGDPTVDDADLAKAEGTGFIGVPSRAEIPNFCGKCHADPQFMHRFQPRIHTDQLAQFAISVHGQRLMEQDDKVAECASCHTSHGILPASDSRSTVYPLNLPQTCNNCHGDADYMRSYGVRTNQFELFAKSVHGVALLEKEDVGAPACNDCHGNHGAMPPDVSSLNEVCGTCHINNQMHFDNSPLAEPFEEEGLAGCIECHGYHNVEKTFDEMVGIGDQAVCIECHDEGEDAYEAARQIYDYLASLVVAYDSAEVHQKLVNTIGMDDTDISFLLKEAHQSLVQARTLVHTFDPDKVNAKTAEGVKLSREIMTLANQQVAERKNRRIGFGIMTFFLVMLGVGLYMKLKEMEA